MPRASRTPPLEFDSLDEVAAALREDGGRFSTPRRTVLLALFAAEGPVSADYLARGSAGATRLDVSTVYRTLERLEELGIVRHVHVGHGPGLYALARSAEREYLVCEACHGVASVDATMLDAARAEIRKATGYEARFGHFPIVGLCRSCAGQRHARPAAGRAHPLESSHSHEHSHGELTHAHPHTSHDHDHDHDEHNHEHSHDDRLHTHPHVHQPGLVDHHQHED